jgi:serine protease Do
MPSPRRILLLAALFGLSSLWAIGPVHAENGFLGLQVQGMEARATAPLGFKKPSGAMVRDVAVGGPAASAGFRHGDLIVQFGRSDTDTFDQLIAAVGKTKPDQRVKIVVVRDGKRQSVTMRLGQRPASWNITKGSFGSHGEIGLTVAALTKAIRERFKYRWGLNGLAVTQVNSDKPAAAVLKVGDVILQINLRNVWEPKQLSAAIAGAIKNQRRDLLFLVENSEGYRYIVLTVNPGENL